VVGIGDDAAVIAPERGALEVVTTDAVVEGVHFDRRHSSLEDVGYRALAVNVSDIAAMGGMPRHALLSFLLPAWTSPQDVEALADGVSEMASQARVTIIGGNITRTPGPLALDITVIGAVRPRRFLTRSGGRPGDTLYVTGSIGAAAAGLDWLSTVQPGVRGLPDDPPLAACVARHRRPEPRLRVGGLLGRTKTATACMDVSDGLADAVRQVADACGTGARIDARRLPIDEGARRWFERRGIDPVRAALSASDDYELLFAASSKSGRRVAAVERQARGVALTAIGELTATPDIVLMIEGQGEPLPAGYSHF
jgi:thiamine-monophosphate kinase